MPKIRPRIDDMYLILIRANYPEETANIHGLEKLIEFALKKGLEHSSCKKVAD